MWGQNKAMQPASSPPRLLIWPDCGAEDEHLCKQTDYRTHVVDTWCMSEHKKFEQRDSNLNIMRVTCHQIDRLYYLRGIWFSQNSWQAIMEHTLMISHAKLMSHWSLMFIGFQCMKCGLNSKSAGKGDETIFCFCSCRESRRVYEGIELNMLDQLYICAPSMDFFE